MTNKDMVGKIDPGKAQAKAEQKVETPGGARAEADRATSAHIGPAEERDPALDPLDSPQLKPMLDPRGKPGLRRG